MASCNLWFACRASGTLMRNNQLLFGSEQVVKMQIEGNWACDLTWPSADLLPTLVLQEVGEVLVTAAVARPWLVWHKRRPSLWPPSLPGPTGPLTPTEGGATPTAPNNARPTGGAPQSQQPSATERHRRPGTTPTPWQHCSRSWAPGQEPEAAQLLDIRIRYGHYQDTLNFSWVKRSLVNDQLGFIVPHCSVFMLPVKAFLYA